MANRKRPSGRKKNIGSGVGKVSRRGSGLGKRSGSMKFNSSSSNRTSNRRNGSSSLGSSNRTGGKGKLSLGTIVILLILAFVFFKFFGGSGGSGDLSNNNQNYDSVEAPSDNYVATADDGAYPVNKNVDSMARDKYTQLIGNGDDQVTLMIYLIGTDLETKAGMGTNDLMEIIAADISDQVNIIVETGGTKKWKNDVISSDTNQRYKLTSEGLLLIEDNLGKNSMVDPNNLSDFIQYCEEEYPADRYQLIMWDHGGGSLAGFGYDELHKGDHMTLDEIQVALDKGNVFFDFIGFDACLMGTLETAMVLEPFADYMIASEELEPGIGWYYTDWITELSNNTSIPTTDLGKILIDDYVREVERRTPKSQATLSLIDLAELKATVPRALIGFSESTNDLIDSEEFRTVSEARVGAKEFSKAQQINQIDLIDFANRMGTDEALELVYVLESAIKYNRTSQNISNANGVSIYFPYNKLSHLDTMLDTYEEIDMEDEYMEVVRSFASITAGGQVVAKESGNSSSPVGSLLGGAGSQVGQLASGVISNLISDFLSGQGTSQIGDLLGNATWLDKDKVESSADYYSDNQFDPSLLVISEKNGQKVIEISDKQWDLVAYMEQNVFIDDGQGFINLGLDNVYDWNDDGDLIMDYDGTWLTLNGHVVSYYLVSDEHNGDQYSIRGRIPALLNDQSVNIIVEFSHINPDGTVLGASIDYDNEAETSTSAKGLIEIVEGDSIDFLCDYYTYAGEYLETYYLGESYTHSGQWTIENLRLDNLNYQMTYRFTDIYDNKYWSESVSE